MTTHTITATPDVKFWVVGCEDPEVANPTIEITYSYTPGRPAFTPRGEYAPIDPPEPAEVDLISAKLVDADGLRPQGEDVADWANDWLQGDGYEEACANAEETSGPDPDEAYDRMRDEGEF